MHHIISKAKGSKGVRENREEPSRGGASTLRTKTAGIPGDSFNTTFPNRHQFEIANY